MKVITLDWGVSQIPMMRYNVMISRKPYDIVQDVILVDL